MTTLFTALVGVVLAAGTAIGVAKSVGSDDQRPASDHSNSKVVLYGSKK